VAQSVARMGRNLVVFSACLIALVWIVVAYSLLGIYQARERTAREQTTNLTLALEAYVGNTLDALDVALDGLTKTIARIPAGERSPGAIRQVLKERASGYRSTVEFAFVDANGQALAGTSTGFKSGTYVGDRDYFKAHQSLPAGQLYVGGPLTGRQSGHPFFSVSRAVVAADGERVGVMIGLVDAEALARIFERFSFGPNSAISLIHQDGRVIARIPDFKAHFGQEVGAGQLFGELAKADEGNYESETATDHMVRLIHYRRVGKTSLILAVGVAREDLIDALRGDIATHLVVGLAFTLLIAAGVWQLLRNQRASMRFSRQLLSSERRYQGLYDSLSDGVLLRSREGVVLDCNRAFCEMLGYRREELIGHPTRQFTPAGYEDVESRANEQIESAGYSKEFEMEYVRQDGKNIWVRLRGWKIVGEDGEPTHYWGTARDITAEREAQLQLELSRKVIRHTSEAMLVTDAEERIITVNPAFERITGYAAAEVIGKTPAILRSGRHDAAFYDAMWVQLQRVGEWQGEIWDRRKSGEIYPKYLSINAVREDDEQAPTHYVAIFTDISERKAQEARIEFLAHHDPLTGLPNRAALEAYLEGALAMARRHQTQVAVLFVDLDNFKTINDSLGHQAGDELLCEVASRLQGACRESDRVARLGGDEFVIILEGIRQAEAIAGVAEKILEAVNAPYQIGDRELHTSPSIGISVYPIDGPDTATLMRNADTAMYYAKANGRNNYQFFAEPMNQEANKRLHLESELWRALSENQLALHYQPQIDLLSGKIVGVEALVRWQHPERGTIPPSDFIPIAEETGLILPIGHWVLKTACRQAREWLDQGRDIGEMAVNISAHQFRQPEFAASVRSVLEETGLPAHRLELEITESVVMHGADSSVRMLAELKGMGIKLAIDDFGTGYSSLSYLRRFPIDRLKIDRTFVADLESDQDAASLVASIIALGQSLGLRLVAEGVENEAQADFLKEKLCERVQGYYFHHPDLPEAIQALLEGTMPE